MKEYEIRKEVHTAEEGYIALAGKIVEMARLELKTALITKNKRKIKMSEEWFRGRWFQILTLGLIDPEFVIERTRKEVQLGHKNVARAVQKST